MPRLWLFNKTKHTKLITAYIGIQVAKIVKIHLQPCCYINYWCPDKYMYVDIRILNQSSIQNTSNESINHKFKFSISPFVIDLNFVNVLTNNMYLLYRKQFIASNPIIASLYVIPCSIEWFIIYAKKGEMSPLHNPYIWTKYSLFNRKNIKWCFTMCTLSDKKKEIRIRHVNSSLCDRVGLVVTKDYKFHKTWLRVDEFLLSEENFQMKNYRCAS